jgi:glutathione S-transferase
MAANLPPALVADRARLYLGPDGDFNKEVADLPHVLAQLRAQLGWFEAQLSAGSPYLFGDKPGMGDLLTWFIVWFLRGRNPRADELLAEFPALIVWEARMKTIGHGSPSAMTPLEALAVAKAAQPVTPEKSDPLDPQGLAPGMRVTITPISVGGETAVAGDIIAVDRDKIAIRRSEPACGIVAVHFPRVGYRVTIL